MTPTARPPRSGLAAPRATEPSRAAPRTLLAALSLLLPPVAIALTGAAWHGGLPDRIASHWSDLGAADGSLPTAGVLVAALLGAGIAALAGLVLLVLPGVDPRTAKGAAFWLGMVQGVALAMWIVPAGLTHRAGSPDGAVLGAWIVPLIALILYGAIPYALAPRPSAEPVEGLDPLPLAPGETGAWSRTLNTTVFVWLAAGMAVLTVAIAVPLIAAEGIGSAAVALGAMLLGLLVVAAFVRVRVTVDWRGLRIRPVLLPVPVKHIPLDRVRAVEATQLRPSEWGGWGYRVLPGRSALILRSGPGLVVTTVDDRRFAVTLDDPEVPAGLLLSLAQRSHGGPQGTTPQESTRPTAG